MPIDMTPPEAQVQPAPAPPRPAEWSRPGPPPGYQPTGKVGRPPGPSRFKEPQQALFLQEYERTHNGTQSARVAGVSWATVIHLRKRDEAFAAKMDELDQAYSDKLVEEAHRRAVEGYDEARFNKDGLVGNVRRYSDRMLELLLKRFVPGFQEATSSRTVIQGRVQHNHGFTLDADSLRQLPAEERANLRKILSTLASPPRPGLRQDPEMLQLSENGHVVDSQVIARPIEGSIEEVMAKAAEAMTKDAIAEGPFHTPPGEET